MNRTILSALAASFLMMGCASSNKPISNLETVKVDKKTTLTQVQKVKSLLDSLNTGDKKPVSYINPNKYIQHNLKVADGLAGFGEIMKHKPPQGFKAEVIRAFEDGDYVFTHTKYDFFGPKIGFDIFRFEDGLIVEHWDNLDKIYKPNLSGRTQIDGPTQVTDLDKTEANKKLVENFINDIFINRKVKKSPMYVNQKKYIQHHEGISDGLKGLAEFRKYRQENNLMFRVDKLHKVLGQGNFVLTVAEGAFGKDEHVAFYDLFRVENSKIVEHWDVIEKIPPKSQWKNTNGKFGFDK